MRDFLKRNRDEILICLFFFVVYQRIHVRRTGLNAYIVFQYLLGYQYGFIARGLIGTLIYPLGYLTRTKLYNFFRSATLLLSVSCVYFYHYMLCGFSENDAGKKTIMRTVIWTSIFIPTSICMYYKDLGRLDIYLLMLSFLFAWIVCEGKSLWWAVPICLAEILIYPGVVFMHFIIIEALLLYQAIRNVKGAKAVFWVNSLASGVLFMYFTYAKPLLNLTTEELKISLASRTAVDVSTRIPLIDLWFGEQQNEIGRVFFIGDIPEFFVYLVMMSPLIFIIIKFLAGYFRGKDKFYTTLLALLPLGFVPYVVLMSDYGRLYSAFFWTAFILVMVILKTDDEAYSLAMDFYGRYRLNKAKWFLWAYMLLLGVSREERIVSLSTQISKWLTGI